MFLTETLKTLISKISARSLISLIFAEVNHNPDTELASLRLNHDYKPT